MYFVLKANKNILNCTYLFTYSSICLPTSAYTFPVLLEQNTTLVPLCFLSETLGYALNFTGNKNPITLTKGTCILQFTVISNILAI